MYTSRALQFFLQQGVNHAVPGRLHLRFEGVGGDEQAEMGLAGHAALHGAVVSVHVRVVVDFQGGGMQGCANLLFAWGEGGKG